MRAALVSATSLLALLVFEREVALAVVIPTTVPDAPAEVVTDDDTAATAPPDTVPRDTTPQHTAPPDTAPPTTISGATISGATISGAITPLGQATAPDLASSLFVGYTASANTGPSDGAGPFVPPDVYVPTSLAPWARLITAQGSASDDGASVFIGTPDPLADTDTRPADQSAATETYTYSFTTTKGGPAGATTVALPGFERDVPAEARASNSPDRMTTNEPTGSGGGPANTGATLAPYVYTPIRPITRSVRAGISFTPEPIMDPSSLVDMPVELFPVSPDTGPSQTPDKPDQVVAAGGLLSVPLVVVNAENDELMPDPLPIFYDEASLLAVHRERLINRLKDLVKGPAGVALLGGSLAGLAGLVGLGSMAFFDRRRKS